MASRNRSQEHLIVAQYFSLKSFHQVLIPKTAPKNLLFVSQLINSTLMTNIERTEEENYNMYKI